MAVNRDLISNNKSVFKGISHSISIPPLEIIKSGPKAILSYFNEIERDTVYLLECKMIILGNAGVGKTTLMKKLKDPSLHVEPGKEFFTRGIKIVPWELSCTFADGETHNVKIHSWDFGGQEIYHSTHQFFLTKRSLYLFVWDRLSDTHWDFADAVVGLLRSPGRRTEIGNAARAFVVRHYDWSSIVPVVESVYAGQFSLKASSLAGSPSSR